MVERFIDQGTAEEYWESGGKLNRDSFDKARDIHSKLAKGEKPGSVKNSSLVQVDNMGRFCRVAITPEQKYLYAVLRDMTGETKGKSNSPPELPGTLPAWALTDQRLLAEVIRLTDETNLDYFMRQTNIFRLT